MENIFVNQKLKKEVKQKKRYFKVDPKIFEKLDFKIELPDIESIPECPHCREVLQEKIKELIARQKSIDFKREHHIDDKYEVIPDPSNKEPQQAEKWRWDGEEKLIKKQSWIKRLLNNLRV